VDLPELPERCREQIGGGGFDDMAACALPKGHDGMHTPLAVLWQMTGFMEGPWHPESPASQKIRDLVAADPGLIERLRH
jgi:hypothetical protein